MNYDYKIDINNNNNAHTLCIGMIKPDSKVLDLGCAVGALGEYLHNDKNCTVFGVDCLQEYIDICKDKHCYEKVFCLNLNHDIPVLLEQYRGYFDYILAADVIEHLYDSKGFLNSILPLLKNSGSLVLSIPNTAHASIKLNLLKDNFKYTTMGLLDSTHIRFFTRNSIIELFNEMGLEIVNDGSVVLGFSGYYEPVDIYSYPLEIINFVSRDNESFVYQYVMEVKKGDTTKNSEKLLVDNERIEKLRKVKRFKFLKKRLKRRFSNKEEVLK